METRSGPHMPRPGYLVFAGRMVEWVSALVVD